MPDPTADLRARILEALNTVPASFVRDDQESADAHLSRPWRRHDQHHYDGGCALCRGEADTLADAVMAVLDDTVLRPFTLDFSAADPELVEKFVAGIREWELAGRPLKALPPNAVMIYRRTPEQRRAYLLEHRDEAIANGIPADLIDMLIADAESAADDTDPDVCPDCYGVGYDIGGPEHCTTCRGSGRPLRPMGDAR